MSDQNAMPKELGQLSGPLLVFGGPYSNLLATKAMRAEAERLGIPNGNVICTGDVVAYAAEPSETTSEIMDWGITTVMGNCEENFGVDAEDCGCGFEEGTACDLLSRQWYAYANQRLSAEQRAWKRECPRQVNFELGGKTFAVVHGSAASINEFVFERTNDAVKLRDLDLLGVDAIIGGHSGVPFTQVFGRRLWHNAGVIGMPANDGTPRVWYSIICEDEDDISIEICDLNYDYRSAAQAMRLKGLPRGYADCLETGIWPNMDVMPDGERDKCGVAIEPGITRWISSAQVAAE